MCWKSRIEVPLYILYLVETQAYCVAKTCPLPSINRLDSQVPKPGPQTSVRDVKRPRIRALRTMRTFSI